MICVVRIAIRARIAATGRCGLSISHLLLISLISRVRSFVVVREQKPSPDDYSQRHNTYNRI